MEKTVRISRKAEHDTSGQLHEETLLGIVGEGPDDKGKYVCRKRKTLASCKNYEELARLRIETSIPDLPQVITARHHLEAVQQAIRDLLPVAEEQLVTELDYDQASGKKGRTINANAIYKRACDLHQKQGGARRLELFVKQTLVNIRYTPDNRRPMGGYVGGANYRVDFYTDGRGKTKWQCISMLQINTPDFVPESRQAGCTLLWSAHKGDTLWLDHPEQPDKRIMVTVYKFSPNKLTVGPSEDARMAEERETFAEKGLKFFIKHRAQRVVLNPVGDVKWTFPMLGAMSGPISGPISGPMSGVTARQSDLTRG